MDHFITCVSNNPIGYLCPVLWKNSSHPHNNVLNYKPLNVLVYCYLLLFSIPEDMVAITERINAKIGFDRVLKHFCDTIVSSNTHSPMLSNPLIGDVMSSLNTLQYRVFTDHGDEDHFHHSLSMILHNGRDVRRHVLTCVNKSNLEEAVHVSVMGKHDIHHVVGKFNGVM